VTVGHGAGMRSTEVLRPPGNAAWYAFGLVCPCVCVCVSVCIFVLLML